MQVGLYGSPYPVTTETSPGDRIRPMRVSPWPFAVGAHQKSSANNKPGNADPLAPRTVMPASVGCRARTAALPARQDGEAEYPSAPAVQLSRGKGGRLAERK